MDITIKDFSELLNNGNIQVQGFRNHSKASERYVDVIITALDGYIWEGSIPYSYRRTGLAIETSNDLATYLNEIYPSFTKSAIDSFIKSETERWGENGELGNKATTKGFFDVLLDLKWKSVKYDLPSNPNWARRVQDIKEFGYTLSTNTNRKVANKDENDTHILLIPIKKGGATGYETMSPVFKAKVISTLKSINVYELSTANAHALIPDHKFPEIRWDENTKAENKLNATGEDIINKFQLLDNQRNLQKREVCRNCFQTNIRGTIYGIDYYYAGDKKWAENIPKTGKDAEAGCVGCGWYDIQKWRESLIEKIK